MAIPTNAKILPTTRATVTMVVEVELNTTWYATSTAQQIHDEAIEQVERMIRNGLDPNRIIHMKSSKVEAISTTLSAEVTAK